MTNEPTDPNTSANPDPADNFDVPPRKPRWWQPYTPVKQPVAWLAGVGGSLVLAAAGAGAAARWGTVGVGARVSVLLCLHMIVVVLSERMRKSLPIAAHSLAHLGASLVVPSTIAATAFFGQSWRTCIAVGGLAGIAALELQAKRWKAKFLRGGEVVAVGLAAAGAAAITHAPIGVLLGAAAGGIYALGLRKRASATAATAALTPVLAVFASFNVGPGTIAELGARGSILAWAAPIGSLLASIVFGLEAKRLRSKAFLAAAVGSLVLGGSIAAWHDLTLRQIGFPILVAGTLLAFEMAALLRERSSKSTGTAANPRNNGNAALLDFAELLSVALIAASSGSHWYAPLAVATVAFAIGALRNVRFLHFTMPLGLAMGGVAITAAHTVDTFHRGFRVFGFEGTVSAAVWSATILLGLVAAVRNSRVLAFGVGGAVAGSMLLQLWGSSLQPTAKALAAVVFGTVALGISVALDRKLNGADVAGIALIGVATVFVSWPWAPALVALCGLACVLVGRAEDVRVLQQLGGVIAIGGGVGLLDDPRVPNDVTAGAIITAVAVAEWFEANRGKNRLLHADGPHLRSASSPARASFPTGKPDRGLIPYAISALMGGLWLVSRCVEDLTVTRLSATLAIGMVAVAVGVFRKLNTVAIAGAVVCTTTVLLASKDRLAALPTWVWAMTGGIVLLGLAAGVERRMKAKRA
jgi:hypothetical protein